MRTGNWTRKKLWTFSIISILLVLVVLEIIFRIVFAAQYKNYRTSLYIQGNTLQMSDSALVFRNRPFYLDYYRHYQFNEEGMRVQPRDVDMPEKKPGDFWVFLFGGSAMEGAGSNKDGEWLDIAGVTDHKPEETIAGLLEKKLQIKMPDRKVRVFNAANSGFAVWQSMQRYQQLSAKYKMDWVISMDGENEPAVIGPNETVPEYIRKRWKESALFDFPLNIIIPLTSHSAFIHQLKQFSFHYRYSNRLARNEQNHYPARKTWSGRPLGAVGFVKPRSGIDKAVYSFYSQLLQFDSMLTGNGHPHLLYIQPHIIFRDTARMNVTERALYNYYTATYNDSLHNTFKWKVFNGGYTPPGRVRLLKELHSWDKQVFVDYCHFTPEANEYIATLMANEILEFNNIRPRPL
ncbi:MAG TPA: hypothetical protein VD993_02130 [Chitinophagaceae bacterium]|nr:hypothetical protein [Chitinophagaceae bacterium]